MEQVKYRVEAFIVPLGNDCHTTSVLSETNNVNIKSNKIDNVIASIVKTESNYTENYKNDSLFKEDKGAQNLKNCTTLDKFIERDHIDLNKVNESTLNNFYTFLNIPELKCRQLYNVDDARFSSYINNKVDRLTPIDEKNEDFECKITNLSYHGCKNEYSATVPTPQEVSEEVFKGNWLQKLKDIEQREAVLRNRELALQNREKALFRKEREIKVLERQLKDKLKQVNLHLKEEQKLQDLLKIHNSQKNVSQSLIKVDSKIKTTELQMNDNFLEKFDNTVNKLNTSTKNICTQDVFTNQTEQLNKQIDNKGIIHNNQQEKACVGSSCSSDSSTFEKRRTKQRSNLKDSTTLKSTCSKFASLNGNKIKNPCKPYYEDLDTTLSADIGDSSFVQTSQKFNPDLYKRPYAFTRSASERHGKYSSKGSSINLEVQNLDNLREKFETPIRIEQDKVLERVTKNIFASQDKATKFQHYGLIDHNIENEEKYSYLNLETGNKLCLHRKVIKGSKDRPISWNEESNEWLQKKRKAYNMTTNKVMPKDIEDKENLRLSIKTDKSEKIIKKKDIRNRILTIFR
ncbi:uncharacterized protein LOC143147761 [Ptiloglossa arizonensis]|uniref:uncharacterized protein LOC143147761 n=1 Tax=Ptiloglossa arizonensis TaxID=3350558 RepID=UPI003F9FBBE4